MSDLAPVQQLPVPASQIRRGDRFKLHGHDRVAACDAYRGVYGCSVVLFAGGGEADLPPGRIVLVSRLCRRRMGVLDA